MGRLPMVLFGNQAIGQIKQMLPYLPMNQWSMTSNREWFLTAI